MRISVIIPNYNYGDFLTGTINSLLSQSEKIDEIIVVDDGSTDNSRSILEAYGDKIMAVFQENKGQAAAISNGYSKATGDLICLLDSDDYFAPDKIKILKQLYAEYPEVNWIFHDLAQINGKDIPVTGNIELDKSKLRTIDEREGTKSGKVGYDAPATSGLTFRKTFIDALFPLPAAESIYISDHYIKFYCLAMGSGLDLAQDLGGQLIHGDNLYTGQKQLATRGKIFTNTALALRQKCPDTSSFCNSLMAEGRACLNAANINEPNGTVARYNAELSPFELLLIEIKVFIKTRRYKKTI